MRALFLLTALSVLSVPTFRPVEVAVAPGTNIQSVVDQHPTGTIFRLKAGLHRKQSVTPKDRMVFLGEPGTILDGKDVATFAFGGSAARVKIQGLIIQHYAAPADHYAAILGFNTRSWTVTGNEIRLNAVKGIQTGSGMRVLNNHIHDNGILGISGYQTNNVLVQGNEVAFNNTSGALPDGSTGQAGGMKFVRTTNQTVRDNYVHDNAGKGIWTDLDNIDVLIEDNRIFDNHEQGISHEAGYRAVIRNNVIKRNGLQKKVFPLNRGGIVVTSSPNVEIYGNVLEGNADGIGTRQVDRGVGAHGPRELENLFVHHNQIAMSMGHTGLILHVDDNSYYTSRNNVFDFNSYTLNTQKPFYWNNRYMTAAQWRAAGNDVNGTFE